ncbi:hypothetical protein [Nonomuraea sp. NPDC050786]|uniref:hypothetical protein n=1 Tax=Nonomuraea sp. NPDC050786 TaxID=3154840 RepID=UPI0033D14058
MRLNKSAILSLAVVGALGVTGLSASAASADVDGLSITQVGYNAYGADTVWNRNQEFVDVKNDGATAVNVKDLVVTDQWGKSSGASPTWLTTTAAATPTR